MRIYRIAWRALLIGAAITAHSRADELTPAHPATELTLTARDVEQPLMRYRLLPAEYELQEGDAAPILLRFPWEQTRYFLTVVPTFDEYLQLPLDDPKLRDSGDVLGARFYRELRRAAYRRTADWQYPLGEEPSFGILLPDLQGARTLGGRGLSVWIRWRLAHGDIDGALEAIKVGLAVSRHYSRTPFAVSQLVSASLDSMLLLRLEEVLAAPDCPNLYWALTALPRPLVDLRPSAEAEQRFLQDSIAGLNDLEQLRTEDDWRLRWEELVRLCVSGPPQCVAPGTPEPLGPPPAELQARQKIIERARKDLPHLMPGGTDRVAAMSDAEAGLRWLVHINCEQAQQVSALICLEAPAAIPALRALQDKLAAFNAELGLNGLMVWKLPLSTFLSCQGIQRRIDALRTVEAIRHWAATHDGSLPKSLDLIVETPVPADPFTGRPFHYQVADGTASLSAPGIEVQGKEIGQLRYRIMLRK